MLGCYALVHADKLLFLLREREDHPEYNGVFVATQPQYFDELQKLIHTSAMEVDIDGLPHSWIFISEDLDDFEAKVATACELAKGNDSRIGK